MVNIPACMSVLTRTQTQCQEVLLIIVLLHSTMLKLTAMDWLVHLTTHRKNSPVQFVPSKEYTTNLRQHAHANAEYIFVCLNTMIVLRTMPFEIDVMIQI